MSQGGSLSLFTYFSQSLDDVYSCSLITIYFETDYCLQL